MIVRILPLELPWNTVNGHYVYVLLEDMGGAFGCWRHHKYELPADFCNAKEDIAMILSV